MKAVVTGASGLLGRQVVKAFENANCEVVGTAFSRAIGNLVKLNLTEVEAVKSFIDEQQPDVLVHCAAERRPDVAEKDQSGVLRLNVETPRNLASICKSKGVMLIYISTDYVFDGTSPPYEVDDKPNPLQFYGQTKLDGENVIREVYPDAVILRVPILYGATEYNGESAVNVLIDTVLSKKVSKVDNVAQRYPTNVADVARVLKDLAGNEKEEKIKNKQDIRGIYHFSAKESMTKYQMCETFASILNFPMDHLTPQNTVDPSASVSRPDNSHLSVKRLEEAGIDTHFSFGGLGDYFTLSTALFNWPEIAQATSFAGRPILDFLVALFATTLLEIPSYPIYLLSSSEKDQHHPLLEESAAEEDGDIEGQHVYKKTCMAFLKHPVTLYVALMTIIYTYGGARTNISTGSFYQVTYPKYIPKNQPVGCVVGGGSALPELFTDYDFWFNKSTKLVNAGAKLVLWSELVAVAKDKEEEAQLLQRAKTFAIENQVYITITYGLLEPVEQNKLVLITKEGKVAIDYNKAHPVPMVETQPPGEPIIQFVDTEDFGRIGAAICYDYNFPSFIRQASKLGVDVMLQSTWTWGPVGTYHAQTNSIRAVENGFTLFRCASQGLSGIFEPTVNGIFSQRVASLNAESYLFYLPIQKRVATLYGYIGDTFSYLRPIALLSINTHHNVMMKRGNANDHYLSFNSSMSHAELTSKIADSFQEFSSMLSQLSSAKPSTLAVPVTPPVLSPVPRSPKRHQRHTVAPLPSPPTTQSRHKSICKSMDSEEDRQSEKSANDLLSRVLLGDLEITDIPHCFIPKSLAVVVCKGKIEMLKRMIRLGMDLNSTENEHLGITPLMYAAYFGKIDCLRLMLEQPSILVNQQDKKGWTALMWGASGNQAESVQLLLKHNAEIIITKSGRTMVEYPICETIKSFIITRIKMKNQSNNSKASGVCEIVDKFNSIEHDLYDRYSINNCTHFLNSDQPSKQKDSFICDTQQDVPCEINRACSGAVGTEDEKGNDWKIRWIKRSVNFDWDHCLPDQMFVFSYDQVSLIVDQIFNLTTDDIKLLRYQDELSSELWAPANTVFLCARFAYYCFNRELLNGLLDAVITRLSKVIKGSYREIYCLSFWIANCCQLVGYLKKDAGLCIVTSNAQEALSTLIAEAYILFVKECQKKLEKILEASLMEYDPIQEHAEFSDDWQRFFFQRYSNVSLETIDEMCPQTVTQLLGHYQSILQSYHVLPVIIIQAMAQFFYYLSCELFNRILSHKRYLCRSKALQIRLNLSTVEEWVRNHKLPSSLNHAFEPLIQLLQLLQCLSQLTDVTTFTSTVYTFDKLNPLQINRCVQRYRYEVAEPKLPYHIESLSAQIANTNDPLPRGRRSTSDSKRSSVSSLNSLITPKSKRASIPEFSKEDKHDEEEGEQKNSKYLLPFSVFNTTALLQDWEEEKQKRLINQDDYSEAVYQEIKLKKLEEYDLLDRIVPSIPDEWLYNIDRKLQRY
ncbi:hypothetical protein G6F42_001400 [Rhizopus arrhizus]|nr:hypothetical protein G6F42_001400 [Rhizopus arrhizus]